MEDLKVKKWLSDGSGNGSGYGSGYGSGFGFDYGNGSGNGYGSGYGYGDGNGYGDGSCSGYGSGNGSGYGSGNGSGNGSGYGYGDGSGDGNGIKTIYDMTVFKVDDVQTIIYNIKGNLAKGFILQSDLTLIPCFVVKGNGCFAHGETVDKARKALQEKIFENMDTEEAINKFMDTFKKGKKYPAKDFYEWHHYLTGSCEMGRKTFMNNRQIDFEDSFTVDEFIDICENDYGGEIIKMLKKEWVGEDE